MSSVAQRFGPFDGVPGHGFADPEHAATDIATLGTMIERFNALLQTCADSHRAVVGYYPDESGWYRRVMIPDPAAFADRTIVTVVGFFGRRRHVVDPEVSARVDDLSKQLFEAIPTVPGVRAYVTQLLVDEYNYANLVIVDDPSVIEAWRETAPHPVAAQDVSPHYYEHVRIYNGEMPASRMDDGRSLIVRSVKYWDFRQTPPWMAVREYPSTVAPEIYEGTAS